MENAYGAHRLFLWKPRIRAWWARRKIMKQERKDYNREAREQDKAL